MPKAGQVTGQVANWEFTVLGYCGELRRSAEIMIVVGMQDRETFQLILYLFFETSSFISSIFLEREN